VKTPIGINCIFFNLAGWWIVNGLLGDFQTTSSFHIMQIQEIKDKDQLEKEAVEWYIKNRPIYKKLAQKVESIVAEILELDNISFHIITSRTKDIDSFKVKIRNEKYDDPIQQLTDLAGIRIITYVEDEVKQVCETIENVFEIDKGKSLDKSKDLGIDRVGYKSVHYVAKLKESRLQLPEYKIFENRYFEIQIRTILQHAWAEIEHDRNYKFSGKLPEEIARRFKLLSGTLEIADREFNNIAKEIDLISKRVEEGTKTGKLNFEINSTSLKQYLETKLAVLWQDGFSFDFNIKENQMKELEEFGIHTLKQLNDMMSAELIEQVRLHTKDKKISAIGLIRLLLIINNPDKYFQAAWDKRWEYWSYDREYEEIFLKYNTDWEKIETTYGVKLSK
jgi:putative GTP pyrophosphokinase